MRRRAADYRRPIRRRLSWLIWVALLLLFLLAGFVFLLVQHNHRHHMEQPVMEINPKNDWVVRENRNLTDELLSTRSYARQLAEQMTLAKAYVVIAKEHHNLHLAWELSSKIRTCQMLLSEAAMRDQPIPRSEAEPIITSLSSALFKAQDAHYDIATTIVTMKSHIQALEERSNAATVQSALFGQLASETVPKNIHCFDVKLASDWVKKGSERKIADVERNSPRLVDNNLCHFCVFSDNILAVSVVINSTVSNAEHPERLVFHVVTSRVVFGAMQAWFVSNDFKGATIEVQSVEELAWLNASYSSIVDLDTRRSNSLLNHLRFYIPEIYPQLVKVVFLDHDVVVQKDLTPLFSLDLHGNVNGAVETCLESFHRYYKFLNFSNPVISTKFDPQACGWAFGMNVFDLIAWRKHDVTSKYHFWQEQNVDGSLWRLGTLPPGLLAFYGLTEPLDRRWHVLGLGYDLNIDNRLIETAAVVHFNGNMKPWLKMSLERYRGLWEQYVNHSHQYLQDCALD